jgi:hypothetical protein
LEESYNKQRKIVAIFPIKCDRIEEFGCIKMDEICLNCGSENIEIGVLWGDGFEDRKTGPLYREGKILRQTRSSRVYCDICRECGEITRSYINFEERDWVKMKRDDQK